MKLLGLAGRTRQTTRREMLTARDKLVRVFSARSPAWGKAGSVFNSRKLSRMKRPSNSGRMNAGTVHVTPLVAARLGQIRPTPGPSTTATWGRRRADKETG